LSQERKGDSSLHPGIVPGAISEPGPAIGCSTGGPKALQSILPSFPKDFPAAILIVQHMPKFFTAPFAQRLDQLSHIEVREAVDGDVLTPG
jgi:two-component system chemotaxis response regulator CheB